MKTQRRKDGEKKRKITVILGLMNLQQRNTHARKQLMGEAVKYRKCFCVISVGVNQWGSADINEANLTYGRESVSLFPMMTTNV